MSLLNFSCLQNVSQDSITEIGWTVDNPVEANSEHIVEIGYATAVIVSLIFLIGVPWNLFVIVTIVKKKLYHSPTILLLLNLAITNLLLCLLVMPFNIITGFSGEYLFGPTDAIRCHVCQSTGIIIIILPVIALHTLSLMAVDRFIYLKKPLRYSTWITPKRMIVTLIIIWIVCTIFSLPPLFGFGEIKFTFTVSTCILHAIGRTSVAPNFAFVLFALAPSFLLPVVVLFVMYAWILYIARKGILERLKRRVTHRAEACEPVSADTPCEKRMVQLRLVRVFLVIFTANLLTWLPAIGLTLAAAIIGPGQIPAYMDTISYLSFISETAIHPILEACLIREVRMTMTGYVSYWWMKLQVCKGQKVDESLPSTM